MNRWRDKGRGKRIRRQVKNLMWHADLTEIDNGRCLLVTLHRDGQQATFREVLDAWQQDESFRQTFIQMLAAVPFTGFRWECPPLNTATVNREFECVLLRSDGLERRPDAASFGEFFATAPEASIVGFPSLGRDAFLIAPCPRSEASAYPHLASFVRNAPSAQVHELWQRVGQEVSARLSERPVWLSTAGMGVAWLHVRLDSRPKYYGHRPYTAAP